MLEQHRPAPKKLVNLHWLAAGAWLVQGDPTQCCCLDRGGLLPSMHAPLPWFLPSASQGHLKSTNNQHTWCSAVLPYPASWECPPFGSRPSVPDHTSHVQEQILDDVQERLPESRRQLLNHDDTSSRTPQPSEPDDHLDSAPSAAQMFSAINDAMSFR